MNAEQIARHISDFVNSTLCGEDELREAAQKMAANHPTLQQKQMRLVCMFIEEMSKKPYADARNQGSVNRAKQIIYGVYETEKTLLIQEQDMTEEEADEYMDKYWSLSNQMPLI